MEFFNIDLVAILIFVLPGYYFLVISGLRPNDGFAVAVNSLFCGILITFILNYFYPLEKYKDLLSNPLAAAVVLSLWGMVFGLALRPIVEKVKRVLS